MIRKDSLINVLKSVVEVAHITQMFYFSTFEGTLNPSKRPFSVTVIIGSSQTYFHVFPLNKYQTVWYRQHWRLTHKKQVLVKVCDRQNLIRSARAMIRADQLCGQSYQLYMWKGHESICHDPTIQDS